MLCHKIAISISITVAIVLMSIMYFHYAAVLEGKNLFGVNIVIDNYLRWSVLIGLSITVLSYVFVWPNWKWSRSFMILFSTLLFFDMAFSVIAIYLCKPLILKGYSKLFSEEKYRIRSSNFEVNEHCCGWKNITNSVRTPDCSFTITCDKVISGIIDGKNRILFTILLSVACLLMIYCIIGNSILRCSRKHSTTNYSKMGKK